MRWALAALFVLALAGCLRVGPGEDLHLVCEEKSASPRKAYGIETLVAQTRVGTSAPLTDERLLAVLEAARGHVVTPRGASHAGFTATLGDDAAGGWLFHGVGVWDAAPQDDYWVRIGERDDGIVARARDGPGPVQASRTLVDAAWAAVNATPDVSARAGSDARVVWGAWDPATPSCVRVLLEGPTGSVEAVANLAQGRIVEVQGPPSSLPVGTTEESDK